MIKNLRLPILSAVVLVVALWASSAALRADDHDDCLAECPQSPKTQECSMGCINGYDQFRDCSMACDVEYWGSTDPNWYYDSYPWCACVT